MALLVGMLCLPAHAGGLHAAEPAETPSPGQEPSIEVTRLNDYLLFFFDGRDSGEPQEPGNWVSDAAMKLGVGTYAIHRGDEALVYDTFTSLEQARWVRSYLEAMGIRRFTVVQSHWHLDHIAGNAVYADSPILSSALTWVRLLENREAIEAGTLWGPPAINPVVFPTLTFDQQIRLFVGDLEVHLLQYDIHTQDSTLLYLPQDKLVLVGDMLEDPLTYMTEVEGLPDHLAELQRLRELVIARIFPNHGDPAVITRGGYDKSFIDATTLYIARMLKRAHDEDFLSSPLEAFIGDALARGQVNAFEPYRDVHEMN
ncbi:MAG TPA: MBL fold metallo-hydrolase, partial [Myxococcaceae bacterium]|nr:MBL fold metallo-hydrolase [Myxococcaceae bacterium]